MTDSPVRVGIVGYGFAGRGFHAYLLTHEPRLRLTAVATRDPGRRAQAEGDHGVQTYPTLAEMLAADSVDLVIIATPHDLHAEQSIQVMDAGKHCVCDKVLCLTTAEADAMIAARDRNGVLFSVFHNRRWDGDYLTIRKVLAEGLIGEPRLFEVGVWRFGRPRTWRGQKSGVGTIMHDWGAHFVDQMLQLVPGQVVSVFAQAQYHWPDPEVDVESYLALNVRFDSGLVYRLELSNRARLGKPHWFVIGDKGALTKEGVDPQERAMLQGDIKSAREDPANYALVATDLDGLHSEMRLTTLAGDWTAYYRNIADVLEESAKLVVTAEQARRGVAVLQAMERSIDSGEAERFSSGF